jgi:hypothetical protein
MEKPRFELGRVRITSGEPCPTCQMPLNRSTCTMGDKDPKPGDLTVCIYCNTVLQFGKNLERTVFTGHLSEPLRAHLDALRAMVREVHRRHDS